MIKFANAEIRQFVSFISNPDIPPVEIYIIPEFDCIETDEGRVGFACYIEGEDKIFIPEGLTKEDKQYILLHIAHEYYHHIEHCLGIEHDENEAEAFADRITELWAEYKTFQKKFSDLFLSKGEAKSENY